VGDFQVATGGGFWVAIRGKTETDPDSESMGFAAAWTDRKPDFVYVFVSSRGVARSEVLRRSQALLLGALAHYGKNAGIFITDRDGVSYEVGLFANGPLTPELVEFGRKHFGHLKTTDRTSTLVPDTDAM
jgi:hypothetical protein